MLNVWADAYIMGLNKFSLSLAFTHTHSLSLPTPPFLSLSLSGLDAYIMGLNKLSSIRAVKERSMTHTRDTHASPAHAMTVGVEHEAHSFILAIAVQVSITSTYSALSLATTFSLFYCG